VSAADWVVIVAGAAAIAWVNWYFFLAGRATNQRARRGGVRE